MLALQLAGVLALALWLYLVCARGAFWREFAPTPETDAVNSAPSVAVIIPARNEEATAGATIESLANQQYPGPVRIVLVDDDSEDATTAIALAAAPRSILAVIQSAPLAPGWTGKLWAVAQGVDYAAAFDPQYFLLTDADIVHSPANLASLVARAGSGNFALVSYMATLRCRTFAERALVPAFVFFFFMLYPPRWVRDPNRRIAGAAGGCMLIRRDALERIGGIRSIRGELIDDCALAAAVKRSGGRVWLGLGPGVRSLREYRTLGDIAGMIARTAYTQLRCSPVILLGTLLAMAVTYVVPPILTLAVPQPARGLGALAWLLMSITYVPALRFYRRSPLWAPFLPLIAMFYAGCTVLSAVRHWRGAGGQWKGRSQAQ